MKKRRSISKLMLAAVTSAALIGGGLSNPLKADAEGSSSTQNQAKLGWQEDIPKDQANETAPDNADTVVPDDDFQGTKIQFTANSDSLAQSITSDKEKPNESITITPDDISSGKSSVKDYSFKGNVNNTTVNAGFDFLKNQLWADRSSEDLVMKGDLSIRKDSDNTGSYDTTSLKPFEIEEYNDKSKQPTYSLKSDLNVSAVHNALDDAQSFLELVASLTKSPAGFVTDAYVNNLNTGLRATFTLENSSDGSFYVPTSLDDAKEHYVLSSGTADYPIYKIDYKNSTFTSDKVVIKLKLDLTNVKDFKNTYSSLNNESYFPKQLYGNYAKENFNHLSTQPGYVPSSDGKGKPTGHDGFYGTSIFGNLYQLISNSTQDYNLVMNGIKFNTLNGESTIDDEGNKLSNSTITGKLVGYVNADVGSSGNGTDTINQILRIFSNPNQSPDDNDPNKAPISVSYQWGTLQTSEGKDSKANNGNVSLTVQQKKTPEPTETPDTPKPTEQPAQPTETPDTPKPTEQPAQPTTQPTTEPSVVPTSTPTKSVTVNDPPISKVVEGDKPSEDSDFRFTMKADDPSYPMPEGSENGVKTVNHKGEGSIEFGNITFTKPGTYTYTLSEENENLTGYQFDTSVYKVTYVVSEGDDGKLTSSRTIIKDEKAVDGVVFTNHYTSSAEPVTPVKPNNKPEVPAEPTVAPTTEPTVTPTTEPTQSPEAVIVNPTKSPKPTASATPKTVKKNTAKPSEKKKNVTPDTSDHSNIWLYGGLLIVMIGIVGAVIYIRKKSEN